jgi:hypothetical protein
VKDLKDANQVKNKNVNLKYENELKFSKMPTLSMLKDMAKDLMSNIHKIN